ncbi:membrane protein [Streptomyces fumigatiscleroticus]|nr:membrane protein [Streptomyces fumigatiscleroticus]
MTDGDQRYDEDGDAPLGGYATLATTFATGAGLFALVARRRGLSLPDHVPPWDVALLGTATFKASRLLTKDKVTSFLRAPFTRREGQPTDSEVMDAPRGEGLRRAVGDLVSCPFCTSAWVAGALVACYASAPRAARLVCAGLASVTVADWLQYAWSWTEEKAEG